MVRTLTRLALALALLLAGPVAHAQVIPTQPGAGPFTTYGTPGSRQANAQDVINALNSAVKAVGGKLTTPSMYGPSVSDAAGYQAMTVPGSAPVNSSGNPGIAPTYFGATTFKVPGLIADPTGHINLTGMTRGWSDGTCLLAVNANPLVAGVQNGCGQGGFWDAWYRTVYPGQDSDAAAFGISGIYPVATNAPVAKVGSAILTNFAGQSQIVGTITFATPLTASQIAAINASNGPMRVQFNNGYFGYIIPPGMTQGGVPITAASADGTTLYVDNFTRAITPSNSVAPGTAGGVAALPTLPYWIPAGSTSHGNGLGTGIYPTRVGQTNGSPALSAYTVTIDGNYLADVFYLGFHTDNKDVLNDVRIAEFVGVNNKTGVSTWNELDPLGDLLNGQPFLSHIIFGGCQNDDGLGNGDCGLLVYVGSGVKRGMACVNPQVSVDIGATDCVLDTKSVFGWKSTKTSGYALWLDPGATGTPVAVLDYAGNFNDTSRIYVGGPSAGVTISPTGTVTASSTVFSTGWAIRAANGAQTAYGDGSTGNIITNGFFSPGQYPAAAEPGCNSSYYGALIYVTDGRKPGEAAGAGTGVSATCTRTIANGSPGWISLYDHSTVVN